MYHFGHLVLDANTMKLIIIIILFLISYIIFRFNKKNSNALQIRKKRILDRYRNQNSNI